MKDILAVSQTSAVAKLAATIVWGQPPAPGISIAAYTDTAEIDAAALLFSLSEHERTKAYSIPDPGEQRHFVVRRCFQRVFIKALLKWEGSLESLRIDHQLDTQPRCLELPSMRLSFSSSGRTVLACASTQNEVGADIESVRDIKNVVKLAQRFFTPEEAATIEAMPRNAQNIAFLKYWTAKEAGLKAIGKGIVFGLNSFTIQPQDGEYLIENALEKGFAMPWKLHHLPILPHFIVAVVHNFEK
jgi:4'-phosphopantetheinyl transferase